MAQRKDSLSPFRLEPTVGEPPNSSDDARRLAPLPIPNTNDALQIQRIRRSNDCKGAMMEEWHQKLHNNTSPDDVVIRQALMDYIKNDFNINVYWKTLNDNGITKELLLSYNRAIHSEPNFRRDQRDGLLRDLGHYMRTLKGQGFMVGVQINLVPSLQDDFRKVADFGIAKLSLELDIQTHVSTRVICTFG
ncbi:hypothetical protein OROMI_000935 [Orobanche minor]